MVEGLITYVKVYKELCVLWSYLLRSGFRRLILLTEAEGGSGPTCGDQLTIDHLTKVKVDFVRNEKVISIFVITKNYQ